MNPLDEQVLRTDHYFSGRVIDLSVETVSLADGLIATRELVGHAPAVCVLPFLDETTVVLVKQYRNSIKQVLLEVPAGGMNPGERPEEAAKRELKEETGYEADQLIYCGCSVLTPGFCNEVMHLFYAKGLSKGEQNLDCDENVECVTYSIDKLKDELTKEDALLDGKTQLLLFRYLATN